MRTSLVSSGEVFGITDEYKDDEEDKVGADDFDVSEKWASLLLEPLVLESATI